MSLGHWQLIGLTEAHMLVDEVFVFFKEFDHLLIDYNFKNRPDDTEMTSGSILGGWRSHAHVLENWAYA